MKVLQGLGSLGVAAVGVWVLTQVSDPVQALTAAAGVGLLLVAWVVRPKKLRRTGSHVDASRAEAEGKRRSVFAGAEAGEAAGSGRSLRGVSSRRRADSAGAAPSRRG